MGVFVGGDNLILTAAHVLHGEPGIWANRPGGADMLCTLVAINPAKDLALLRVDGAGRPMRLAAASACPGEPLFIITGGEHPFGYSGGTARQVYTTKASFPETELNVRALEMGCTLNLGDSGSMIVDGGGNLVGICSYFDLFRNESYIGIDVSEIRAFLAEAHP